MYAEPNNDSPLNTQAAALWANQEGTRFDVSLRFSSRTKNPAIDPSVSCSESRFVVSSFFVVQSSGR
jgi:hypothetical protein